MASAFSQYYHANYLLFVLSFIIAYNQLYANMEIAYQGREDANNAKTAYH
jgi:hypothetical protein